MPIDQKQGQLASLIISIIILIIVIILIVIVCCNWGTNNTNVQQPRIQNPQALAAAYVYKNKDNFAYNNYGTSQCSTYSVGHTCTIDGKHGKCEPINKSDSRLCCQSNSGCFDNAWW